MRAVVKNRHVQFVPLSVSNMLGRKGRIEREKKTVKAMIRIYCRDHHAGGGELCDECAAMFDYAGRRLDRCVFGDEKPACNRCPVHCYKPDMRERVRVVMRYAGPRMIRCHLILAVMHLIDERRSESHIATEEEEKKK
jgi:hypothetical protein